MNTLANTFKSVNLTGDQSDLLCLLERFFSTRAPCFILKGYAGTGKTFMMRGITHYLRAAQIPFCLLAPTGRAAKIISQKTKCPASTIHKAIYLMDDLKEYKEKNIDGTETFKYYFGLANNDEDSSMVYIVDEASMISNVYSEAEFFRFGSGYLLDDFFQYVNLDNNDHHKKIIFIGDDAQLPPVNSKISPALDRETVGRLCGEPPHCYELTEVVRQKANSGILENATEIRERIRKNQYNAFSIDTSHSDVSSIKVTNLLESYQTACSATSDADAVVVAHSNRKVKDYNDLIRQHRFPNEPTVCVGDRVLVVRNCYHHQIPLLNGEFGKVVGAADAVERRTVFLNKPVDGKRVNVPIDISFRELVIVFNDLSGGAHKVKALVNESLLNSKERCLSSDESKALYIDFKSRNPSLKPGTPEFKEAIKGDEYVNSLQLKYGYAVTCHKAQGGEWKYAFVDFASTMGTFSEGFFRWAYTAITRAKTHLYGLNTPSLDVLTPENSLDVELPDSNANVISISVDNVEYNSECGIPCDAKFSRLLYAALVGRIKGIDVKVRSVEPKSYCDHYTFEKVDVTATALIDYSKLDTVTHVRWKPNVDESLKTELEPNLKPLEGKRIVLVGEINPVDDDPIEVPTGTDYQIEFFVALRDKGARSHVGIVEAKHLNPYLGRYHFSKAGHRACIDFSFNKKGRITNVSVLAKATTSDDLVCDVMELAGLGKDSGHE